MKTRRAEFRKRHFSSSSCLVWSEKFLRSLAVTFVHLLHRSACFIFCLTSLFI